MHCTWLATTPTPSTASSFPGRSSQCLRHRARNWQDRTVAVSVGARKWSIIHIQPIDCASNDIQYTLPHRVCCVRRSDGLDLCHCSIWNSIYYQGEEKRPISLEDMSGLNVSSIRTSQLALKISMSSTTISALIAQRLKKVSYRSLSPALAWVSWEPLLPFDWPPNTALSIVEMGAEIQLFQTVL